MPGVKLVHLGFNGWVAVDKIVAVVPMTSNPIKRLVRESYAVKPPIDMTSGRTTKSVIFMENGNIVLISLEPETVNLRINQAQAGKENANASK